MSKSKKRKTFDNEFKNKAVQYVNEHSELWLKEARESDDGKINAPRSGNYQSDVAKENARLKRELRDTKDALAILKKALGILEK